MHISVDKTLPINTFCILKIGHSPIESQYINREDSAAAIKPVYV